MGDAPLRIRLDLSKLCLTTYNNVWFPVAQCALNLISDLKVNICKRFDLKQNSIQLFVDGGLMRDEDTVLLLRENDVVRVLYDQEHQDGTADQQLSLHHHEKKHKKKRKHNLSLIWEDLEAFIEGRDGHPVSTTPPKKKRKKSKIVETPNDCEEQAISDRTFCQEKQNINGLKKIRTKLSDSIETVFQKDESQLLEDSAVQQPSETFSSTLANGTSSTSILIDSYSKALETTSKSDFKVSSLDSSINNSFQQNSPTAKKKKRKRRRKRKVLPLSDPFTTSNTSEQTSVIETPFKPPSLPVKHIKFSALQDSTCEFSTPNVFNEQTFEFDTDCQKALSNKSLNFEETNKTPKFISCQETPDSDSSPDDEDNCAIDETRIDDLKDGSEHEQAKTPSSKNMETRENVVKNLNPENCNSTSSFIKPVEKTKDYNQYDTINCLPPIGTHIAFKMLELSELYCPQISEYKEGIISAVDPSNDVITLDLVKEEIKKKEGKFENVYEDEELEEDIVRQVAVKWAELVNPKLIPI